MPMMLPCLLHLKHLLLSVPASLSNGAMVSLRRALAVLAVLKVQLRLVVAWCCGVLVVSLTRLSLLSLTASTVYSIKAELRKKSR